MPKSMSVLSQHWSVCLIASSCNAGLWKMSNGPMFEVYGTSKNAVSQFCELDTSHTAVYCIFIIHTGLKACRGIQGIYANEDW